MKNLSKLVIKTISITLASVLGAFLLTFGALALFSPITIAKLFDGLGGYSSSIRFYERHYEKTGDIDDLVLLVLKIDGDSDSELVEGYLAELIKHEDFAVFCQKEGQATSKKEFYYGKYAVALAKNAKFSDALVIADSFVNELGYTANNPFRTLLVDYGVNFSAAQLDELKNKISSYSISEEQGANRIQEDLILIEELKTQL